MESRNSNWVSLCMCLWLWFREDGGRNWTYLGLVDR